MFKQFIIGAVLLATALPVVAQQFASLGVSVTDPAGQALARANVSARNLATDVGHPDRGGQQ